MAEETVTATAEAAAPAAETPNWDDEPAVTEPIVEAAPAVTEPVVETAPAVTEPVVETAPVVTETVVEAVVKARVKNPMDDFREALRQMGDAIGEGGTSFLLAEFFGVNAIDELEGKDVFDALEKFNKLQP